MPQNAFEHFLNTRNARLVKRLEDNREMSEAIQGLLERTVEYCDHRGVAFKDVKVRDTFISQDGHVSMRLTA